MRTGTSHFVSKSKAARYYYKQAYGESYGEASYVVDQKLAAGEIHIGPPALKSGQKLSIIDGGARYAIED